jgi:maleylacetate reductase
LRVSGFRIAGTALHQKLCHLLGGSFDLPHAEVHTIVLPHATAYNRQFLAEVGLREQDLDRAAELAAENPYPNPTPLTRAGLRALLDDAVYGRRTA